MQSISERDQKFLEFLTCEEGSKERRSRAGEEDREGNKSKIMHTL